jgi:hypothetical protein
MPNLHGSFDSATIVKFGEALDAVWAEIGPTIPNAQKEETRNLIAARIVGAAASGATKFKELKKAGLDGLASRADKPT